MANVFVFNSMDGSPFKGQSMRPDWNVLQIWAPEGDDTLLSQVSYLQSFPQNKCLIYVHPRHETLIHTNFQKVLKIQVRDTLKLLQALQNSLRDSTMTTLRPLGPMGPEELSADHRRYSDLSTPERRNKIIEKTEETWWKTLFVKETTNIISGFR